MTEPITRRDFLLPATASVGAITVGAALWGLGRSLAPSSNAAPATLSLDLTGLIEGAELTVNFEGKPLVVRHRNPQDIAAAEAVDVADLVDPLAQNLNLAGDALATDQNRRATPDGRFLVMSALCTREDCVVLGNGAGDFSGYFCPCCGAHYDTAGRIRKAPAPLNLPIPAYEWQEPGILTLYSSRSPTKGQLDRLIYG